MQCLLCAPFGAGVPSSRNDLDGGVPSRSGRSDQATKRSEAILHLMLGIQ